MRKLSFSLLDEDNIDIITVKTTGYVKNKFKAILLDYNIRNKSKLGFSDFINEKIFVPYLESIKEPIEV